MLAIARSLPKAVPIGLACFALWGLIFVLLTYIAGDRAGLLEDDSYFYAQVAFNSQRYGIFSFDGLQATSGFHPLWGALLSVVGRLTGLVSQDKSIHLASYLTLWGGIVAAIACQVGRTGTERAVLVGLCLLTAPLMETALLTLIWIGIAAVLCREEARRADDLTLGVLAALVPLARVDAAPFVLFWLPCVWSRRRQRVFLVLGLALGVTLHFVALYACFGHFATVSALLKAGGASERGLSLAAFRKVGLAGRALVLLALLCWAWLGLRRARQRRRFSWLVFAPPVLFSLGHVAAGDLRSWHCLPGFVFAFWSGVQGIANGREGERPGTIAIAGFRMIAALTLLLSLYKSYRFLPLDEVRRSSWDFVADARRLLEPEARIYQVDGSGFTGYWIDRHLINGDGLVNTHKYARRLKTNQLAFYLEEMDVCYIITDAAFPKRRQALVRIGGLTVKRSEAREMLRSNAYGWSENQNAHYILWRLNQARCKS